MAAEPIVCLWPDYEAPWDWDDPAVCRRPATCRIRFKGAQEVTPTCDSCAEVVLRDCAAKNEPVTKEPLEVSCPRS